VHTYCAYFSKHVVLRSILFTASIYLDPFSRCWFFRFLRFSPILTLWTLQTAVTRSFMVRFEKFLQFWNGRDVASRGGASDTRLRSRRVWRSLYATPLIVFLGPYHNRVLDQLVLLSITPSIMKIFRSRFSRACTRTVANVSQNYNFLGWWFGGKMGVRKKKFSKKKFFFPQLFCIFLNIIS
jgi:hypothetical protein